jgi:hypothetical protein
MGKQTNQDTPNRPSNMEKAEGDRKSEWGEGTSEGAGASNRPMGQEPDSQTPMPERGKPDSNDELKDR